MGGRITIPIIKSGNGAAPIGKHGEVDFVLTNLALHLLRGAGIKWGMAHKEDAQADSQCPDIRFSAVGVLLP